MQSNKVQSNTLQPHEEVHAAADQLGIQVVSTRRLDNAFTNTVFLLNETTIARVTPHHVTTLERCSAQMQMSRDPSLSNIVVAALHDNPIQMTTSFVTFWKYEPSTRTTTWSDIGSTLRGLHHNAAPPEFERALLRPAFPETTLRRIERFESLEASNSSVIRQLKAEYEDLREAGAAMPTELGRGLIHAELHLDNAIVTHQGCRLIDLDELSIGIREMDLCAPVFRYPTIETGLASEEFRQLSISYGFDVSHWPGIDIAFRIRRLGHIAYLLYRLANGDVTVVDAVIERLSRLNNSETVREMILAARQEITSQTRSLPRQ